MGRPPTSGYCHTCRKRRIKCDKTRPSCLRCLKAGYVCKGYDLGLRMQSLVVVTEPHGSQRLVRIPPSDESSNHSGCHNKKHAGYHHPGAQTQWHVRPAPEMNLTAFQEHMAFSYFFATYGWAYFWKPFLQLAKEETDLAPGRAGAATSHTCSLALVYGHMGLAHGERGLQSTGLELYSRSIREVQTLLTQSQSADAKMELARLCVPIVILGMYSYAVDKDLRLLHFLGVARILRHCGPECFQEEPLLTTFRSCRALLICQSFANRKRTFMEEEVWKTVPWEKLPKTSLDSLLDILADIPGIVYDMAASEHPISPSTKAAFQVEVGDLKALLQTWRWEWHRSHADAARQVPSRLNLEAVNTPVFKELLSTQIDFNTTQQALEMLTYNAGLIYLMQLEDLLDISPSHGAPLTPQDMGYILRATASHPRQPLLLPGEAKFICQPALEAFRLVPSLYHNLVTSKDRIMVMLAPMGIVYCSLQNHPHLSRCMKSVLADIPFFGGAGGGDAQTELRVYDLALGRAWGSSRSVSQLSVSSEVELDWTKVS